MVEISDMKKIEPLADILDFKTLAINTEKIFPEAHACSFTELCKAITYPTKTGLLMSREHVMSTRLYNAYNALITNDTIHIATRSLVALHYFSLSKGKIINCTQAEREADIAKAQQRKMEAKIIELNETMLKNQDEFTSKVTQLQKELTNMHSELIQMSLEKSYLTKKLDEVKSMNAQALDQLGETIEKRHKLSASFENMLGQTMQLRLRLNTLRNMTEEAQAQMHQLSRLNELTVKTTRQLGDLRARLASFKKSTKMTYFSSVYRNQRLNSRQLDNCLTQDEKILITEYDEELTDTIHDSAFLEVYAKIARETGYKCALKYRNLVACKYWGLSTTGAIKNQAAKFYITYVDPFNVKGQTSFVQFMKAGSTKRRINYTGHYRQFDLETGNNISIFAQDKNEDNFLESYLLDKCKRTKQESKENISYDTSYIPFM